jgi:hypothetical protein
MTDQEIDAELRNLEQMALAVMDASDDLLSNDHLTALSRVTFGIAAILQRIRDMRAALR